MGLGRERLDYANAAEGLAGDLVQRGHPLQQSAAGPLHHPTHLHEHPRRNGDENQKQKRQLPSDQAGRHDARQCLERLADDPSIKHADADAERLHVIGQVGHHPVAALVVELPDIEVNDIAINAAPQVAQLIGDAADERFLQKLEYAAECDGRDDDAEKRRQSGKLVCGSQRTTRYLRTCLK